MNSTFWTDREQLNKHIIMNKSKLKDGTISRTSSTPRPMWLILVRSSCGLTTKKIFQGRLGRRVSLRGRGGKVELDLCLIRLETNV